VTLSVAAVKTSVTVCAIFYSPICDLSVSTSSMTASWNALTSMGTKAEGAKA
jgi:hypothetical protein